jgi:hypothetical protein
MKYVMVMKCKYNILVMSKYIWRNEIMMKWNIMQLMKYW